MDANKLSNETMPRPKKNADEKMSEPVRFWTTPHNRDQLTSKSQAAGLGEAEFLRRLIDATPLPSSVTASDPAKIAALNAYAVALGKIGNNVNQLSAASHQGRDFVQFWREIGDELQADLLNAREALKNALESS